MVNINLVSSEQRRWKNRAELPVVFERKKTRISNIYLNIEIRV